MIIVNKPVAVVSTFIWIGFVCAISFMEAWLKFQAPGITVPLGLGIGRIVFAALNKVEWVLAPLILFDLLFSKGTIFRWNTVAYLIPVILLVIQTLWLLPALDARAQLHMDGVDVSPSNLHLGFIAAEIIKVTSLITFGIFLFRPKS